MSIDRVATNSQTSYMVAQIAKANAALDKTSQQVASGKVSTDYTGIGDKTAALESARAAADRASAYSASAQLAVTQTDLQNTQLTTLVGLASDLKSAIQSAVADADGTGLMSTVESIFSQAKALLNSTDSNGTYLYGGQNSDTAPFTAATLADLSSAGVDASFVDGTTKKSVTTGDGQSQEIGVLASDIGKDLMTTLKSLYDMSTAGNLPDGTLTQDQCDDLTTNVLPTATTAVKSITTATANNGTAYSALQDVVTNQDNMNTLYTGFVSDIEDVDMATALSKLSANQTALQAALTVTSQLTSISLLDYIS